MSKVVSLAKRRGFVFPGSEIYGGFGNFWDYGPLGVLLKNNVKAAWLRAVVQERDDVLPLDSAIIMNPRAWIASGHVASFSDPLVDCKQCHMRWRADQLEGDRCPNCGGELTEPRQFNLMFKTFVGPVEDEANVAYLRPETAQGIFLNFKSVLTTMRQKLPFGIAQIGKAFRNEITPGNFTFRTREFEQMEIEYFVRPGTDGEWYEHWARPGRGGTPASGSVRTTCACASTTRTSWPTTRGPASTSSTASRSAGASLRASPIGAISISPSTRSIAAKSYATSTRRRASTSCPR